MEKIIIVEDHMPYYLTYKKVIEEIYPSCSVHLCGSEEKGIDKISSDGDFDLLILDGDLRGGHGRNILKILSEEQLEKTLVCSSDLDFLSEAESAGVKNIDKGTRLEEKIKDILL